MKSNEWDRDNCPLCGGQPTGSCGFLAAFRTGQTCSSCCWTERRYWFSTQRTRRLHHCPMTWPTGCLSPGDLCLNAAGWTKHRHNTLKVNILMMTRHKKDRSGAWRVLQTQIQRSQLLLHVQWLFIFHCKNRHSSNIICSTNINFTKWWKGTNCSENTAWMSLDFLRILNLINKSPAAAVGLWRWIM